MAKTEVPTATSRQLKELMNTTGKELSVSLEDGSTVALEPGSSIKFYKPLVEKNRRIIYLEGEALFNVTKDKTRPFTVYSEALSTTALGTSFTVKSYNKDDEISVALHEGKVVVRSADPVHKKLANELFLLPGDVLIYNKKTMLATVKHKASGEQMVKTNAAGKKGGTVQRPDWYKFNGLPLPEVFDQLSAYYQVDIYYYPSDVANKYFTGRIEKTDSLDNILKDIALLNLLTITKKNGSYIVKRIH
jgi:ferric-dicitrate binding protein FerR (iron transport regulator)